jgi:hypothetical protein
VRVTPTPVSTIRVSPTPNRYQKTPGTIPATGSPTLLLPLLLSGLAGGLFLRSRSGKTGNS